MSSVESSVSGFGRSADHSRAGTDSPNRRVMNQRADFDRQNAGSLRS